MTSPFFTILFIPSTLSSPPYINKMKITLVPVNDDNYAYLIIDEKTNICAVVDVGEAKKVQEAIKTINSNLKVECVLTTHHHWDHAGGNNDMKQLYPDLKIYGGDERVEGINKIVKNGDVIKIGDNLQVLVHFTPCHTKGHVLYELVDLSEKQARAIFTGDTLFIGGCGRFFEGTPDQMNYALNKVIKSLPNDTLVYCGHEYTEKNLKFALTVEPENKDLLNKYEWAKKQRDQKLPTVPSTVAEEFTYNPFMRVDEPTVRTGLGLPLTSDSDFVMGELRKTKDNWKS